MSTKSIYSDNGQAPEERTFTISILSDNKPGLLNHVTIIFTRRNINIEALNVSETEIEGVSRYTIVTQTTRVKIEKLVKQIRKLIEVLGAFVYEENDIYYQSIALYKVPTKAFLNNNKIELLVRNNGARILVIEADHIVIEKTGHREDARDLLEKLKPFGVLEYVRSGRIVISKSKRKTETFLKELERDSLQQNKQ